MLELVNTIAEDFRKVWNNGTGERIWTNILNIIKTATTTPKLCGLKSNRLGTKMNRAKRFGKQSLALLKISQAF